MMSRLASASCCSSLAFACNDETRTQSMNRQVCAGMVVTCGLFFGRGMGVVGYAAETGTKCNTGRIDNQSFTSLIHITTKQTERQCHDKYPCPDRGSRQRKWS